MNAIAHQIKSFNEKFSQLKKMRGGGYNRLLLFVDYMLSALKYGASASDYFEYEFYDKKRRAREQFCCWRLKKKFMHRMNDYSSQKCAIFNNKVQFLRYFSQYTDRDWLDVANASFENFLMFVDRHESFIVKPQNLSCGSGIRKESVDGKRLEELFGQLQKENALIEELIVQHEKMSDLYSKSLNTIRVAAVRVNDGVHILGAVLRCGSGGSIIDNHHAGGFAAKIDPETGVVISDGVNMRHERLAKHPDTNVYFHGFQIPYWNEVLRLIEKAAKVVDGVRYVGWDVAITKSRPVLVEGNFEGMFDVLQQPANSGIKEDVTAIMNSD